MITGASSGIGAAAARQIHRSRPQDNLVIIGRSPDRTKALTREVGGEYFLADFESLAQVRELADNLQQLERIDALGNNAGGIFDGPTMTTDGFERTWQVNVVAPFLLTSLLQEKLRGSKATVVNTASVANMLMSNFDPADPNTLEHFSPERAYGNAKLGDILLARFIDAHGINAVSFHPGVLATGFGKSSTGLTGKVYSGSPVEPLAPQRQAARTWLISLPAPQASISNPGSTTTISAQWAYSARLRRICPSPTGPLMIWAAASMWSGSAQALDYGA